MSTMIPQKSSELWYPDGSVVLQSENTLFRVYAGFLSQSSTVFREMFDDPWPEEPRTYEDVPLVRIHESAEDALVFLKAIYNPQYDTYIVLHIRDF